MDIKNMVDYLLTCSFMDEFATELFTELTGDEVSQSGLFDDGEQLPERADMAGNKLLPHKYALVARISSTRDTDRIRAANFSQRFTEWIDQQEQLGNYPTVPTNYQAFSISASNGRLTARAQDGKTALYEIPIVFKYWRFVNNA